MTEYSNNNLKVLEKLVNKNIYKEFENQINLRTDKNEELEITVISVKTPEIKSVNLEKKYTAYFGNKKKIQCI